MPGSDRDRVEQRWEQIGHEVKRAPGYTDHMEDLQDFFNRTAEVWDEKFGPGSAQGYVELARQIDATEEAIRILDLGCGSGLELEQVFLRAPNARITGIDFAPQMLERLRRKFSDRESQIDLIEANYLDVPLGHEEHDFALSVLTLHHLPPDNKTEMYRKIHAALKEGCLYVELDQTNSSEGEEDTLHTFETEVSKLPDADRAQWNFDISLAPETNMRLMREGGFGEVTVLSRDIHGLCLIACRK